MKTVSRKTLSIFFILLEEEEEEEEVEEEDEEEDDDDDDDDDLFLPVIFCEFFLSEKSAVGSSALNLFFCSEENSPGG